jgi:signal peptidase II
MKARLSSVVIISSVILLDRLTKLYIQANYSAFDTTPVIKDIFNIVHVENPGAAFGMLAEAPIEWRRPVLVLFSSAIMAVIGWLLFRDPNKASANSFATNSAMTRLGLALVLGGALGNMWDRIFRGTVTDFLQVFIGSYEFPSFNVADSMVDIGAGLLILDMWLTRPKPQIPIPEPTSKTNPDSVT